MEIAELPAYLLKTTVHSRKYVDIRIDIPLDGLLEL